MAHIERECMFEIFMAAAAFNRNVDKEWHEWLHLAWEVLRDTFVM